MTAGSLADLVQARRTGAGKTSAMPGMCRLLAESQASRGPDDRILLQCLAGCTIAASLDALRLDRRNHYVGPWSPEQAAFFWVEQKPTNAPHR